MSLVADPRLMRTFDYTAPLRSDQLARGGMVMDEQDADSFLALFEATHYGWFRDEDCIQN
jgi:hypothetical protein